MNTLYSKFLSMSFLLMAAFSFVSCMDEDERIGNTLGRRWFGDMDMYYDGERARGTELEFQTGWGLSSGTGVEIDYYRYHAVTNYFNWEVRNRVMYLWFDDRRLDCAISNYSLTYDFFQGYIVPIIYDYEGYYLDYENQTPFRLRNYERYWDSYGYGGYEYYYVKGQTRADADSSDYHGIRGFYIEN